METVKIQTIVRMKNGDVWTAPWVKYTIAESDEMLTTIRKVKHLDNLKLTLADGSRVYFNPDDISTIHCKIRRGFWSLPLFRSLPR